MICPNECKQLRTHPEPQTKAKCKAWCFSTSEIKSSCYTELQAYITPLTYNSRTQGNFVQTKLRTCEVFNEKPETN